MLCKPRGSETKDTQLPVALIEAVLLLCGISTQKIASANKIYMQFASIGFREKQVPGSWNDPKQEP